MTKLSTESQNLQELDVWWSWHNSYRIRRRDKARGAGERQCAGHGGPRVNPPRFGPCAFENLVAKSASPERSTSINHQHVRETDGHVRVHYGWCMQGRPESRPMLGLLAVPSCTPAAKRITKVGLSSW